MQEIINSDVFNGIVNIFKTGNISNQVAKKINDMEIAILDAQLKNIGVNIYPESPVLFNLDFPTDDHKTTFFQLYDRSVQLGIYENLLKRVDDGSDYINFVITQDGMSIAGTGYIKWKKFKKLKIFFNDYQALIIVSGMLIIEIVVLIINKFY